MTKPRVTVVVGVESTDDLKLHVKLIHVVDGEPEIGDFVFKWFAMAGNTIEEARENALGSMAFYLRCRVDLRDPILKALEPEARRVVRQRLGLPSEEEQEEAT